MIVVVRHYGHLEGVFIAGDAESFVAACDQALELARHPESGWLAEADRKTRGSPNYYWFHVYTDPPEFWWDEIKISKEYRANADGWALERLNSVGAPS